MFADDLTIFLPNDAHSWKELQSTFSYFESLSGLKINYDKTMVYRISASDTCLALKYSMKKLQWTDDPINILGVLYTSDEHKIQELNLEPIFVKAEAIVSLWNMRDLSLFGSIIMFNTLVSSLFTYRIAALRTIDSVYVKRFDDLIRKAVWRGKKPKIKLNTLKGLKEEGGLNVCDLKYKDMALKIQWIPKLIKDESLKKLAYQLMNNQYGDLIWQGNLTVNDLEHLSLFKCYWTDVLHAWTRHTYFKPLSGCQVREQSLWLNSAIKVENRLIFYKKWSKVGIQRIKHLLNDDGSFMSVTQLYNKYKIKVSFTKLWGVIDAIPRSWKTWIKEVGGPKHIDWLSLYSGINKATSVIYRNLKRNESLLSNYVKKWAKIFPNVSLESLNNTVSKIYLITNIAKLRSFQYRLALCTTITNVHLKYFGLREDAKCTFCQAYDETTLHLFTECGVVKRFWEDVQKHLLSEDIQLTPEKLIFNVVVANPKMLPNLIVLLGKYYIYVSRCKEDTPKYAVFQNQLLYYQSLEKYIAIKNDKLNLHNLKWSDCKIRQ